MKKAFTFVVAIAMTLALTASAKSSALLFNRPQFQPAEYTCSMDYAKLLLTVPLVYKGTVALTIDSLENDRTETWNVCEITDENTCKNDKGTETHCCYVIDTAKKTLPVFMTICQPCIDCFPCWALQKEQSDVPIAFVDDRYYCEALPGKITKWNLYYVIQDKKAKETEIDKFNLLDDAYSATFFTGHRGTKPGFMYIGGYGDLFLNGKKSDYSFKFYEAYLTDNYEWDGDGSLKAQTAYVKSLASMAGSTTISGVNEDLDDDCDVVWDGENEVPVSEKISATFKLSRDASLTKKAVTATFSTEFAKKGKNWEDCNVATPASYCEEYFFAEAGDRFDDYLDATYAKKGWDYELLDYNDVEDGLLGGGSSEE